MPGRMAFAHLFEGVVQILGDLLVLVFNLIEHDDRFGEGVVVGDVSRERQQYHSGQSQSPAW
ncbi:hypothetical protein D3C85_1778820 [compost metagenome]